MNPTSIQHQITQAIKYIKSQFPPSYQQWKQSLQGEKQFQKHLNVIEFMFGMEKFFTLRAKILDEMLIKLRFISMNVSYLEKFQAFLLEKFIRFCVRSLGLLYKLKDIYSLTPKQGREKQRQQLFQRYSILSQCLTLILKFCFNNNSSHHTSAPKFTNQLIRHQQPSSKQIVSKNFVIFILNILLQKLQQIVQYKIMKVKNIYPQYFSTIVEGFLNFKGGSKCLEISGEILLKLISENRDNIWEKSDIEEDKTIRYNKLLQLNKDIMLIVGNKQTRQQQDLGNIKVEKQQRQNTYKDICKQRLLMALQQLLHQFGYSTSNEEIIQHLESELNVSASRVVKLRKFIRELLQVVEKSCFVVEDEQIRPITLLQEVDTKILNSLVLLSIQFIDQQTLSPLSQYHSQLLSLLQNNNIQQSSHIVSSIRHNINSLFMQKFKLLMNRNKTISSQKTILLKQLAKIVRFVSFQKMDPIEFQNNICTKLKELFTPNERDMNKPMIITIAQSNSKQGSTMCQAVPLTQLSPEHSFATYPITLTALRESVRFQQNRHLLDEVRLFEWFQHQQANLVSFRAMIRSFDFSSKLHLLEYFINQLMKMKMEETQHFYALEMSLTKLYQLLILYFYVDFLVSPQGGLLHEKIFTENNRMYKKSIITKLEVLYNLMSSNVDLKRLQISSKEEQLLVFWNLKIMLNINNFLYRVQSNQTKQNIKNNSNKKNNKMKLLHSQIIIAENLVMNLSHQTYLLKLLLTSSIIEFSAPNTIAQTLRPLQSTLIHRNAGSSVNSRICNLEFMKNLIKVTKLKPKQAQQLAYIYLSKDFITNSQANSVISLIFPQLSPQTMRKCILSIKNWSIIFAHKPNIELLSNQPLISEDKEEVFHANDSDNVTVSNALGVIVLQLGEKWVAELQFRNPRKQILIDAMINLVVVNQRMIFWKRFFFESVIPKLNSILKEIETFSTVQSKDHNKLQHLQQKGRRHLLYERIHCKIFRLIYLIPTENYKYSTQISIQVRKDLQELKQRVQKQYNYYKRQCFVYQRYDQYLDSYKQASSILDKIDAGLNYKEEQISHSLDAEEQQN